VKKSETQGYTIWLTILVLMFGTEAAFAQDVTFQGSVDKNPVGVNDQFTLTFSLSSSGAGGGQNMKLPDLGNFRMMSGPNQSSSMQFINGAVSSSVSYSYVLAPKEIGKFTIGSASIDVGGKTYHSNPISLEVVKGSPKPKQQAAAPNDISGQIGDNLFLRATVSKTHIIQGEQVNLAYKLYSRVSLLDVREDKASSRRCRQRQAVPGFHDQADGAVPYTIGDAGDQPDGTESQRAGADAPFSRPLRFLLQQSVRAERGRGHQKRSGEDQG
jgi:hypothetical protein